MEPQALGRASNRSTVEVGALEQYRFRALPYFGIHSAHHTSKRHGIIAGTDKEILGHQFPLSAVQCRKFHRFSRRPDDDTAPG